MNDTNKQIQAVGFLVMAFTDEKAGDEALKAMKAAKKEKKFYFENAAVVRQDASGKVHYYETGDMKTGIGAGVGALVGGVVGILGGPAGVAFGAGTGAAVGAAPRQSRRESSAGRAARATAARGCIPPRAVP